MMIVISSLLPLLLFHEMVSGERGDEMVVFDVCCDNEIEQI